MNEKDNFVLVPRPPSALEKAEPGAKRILSGMVADTLALVPARVNAEAEAWYKKGQNYFVSENYTEAVKWYRKAAEQNNADAQNALGICYHNGDGVPQDYAEALRWYCSAAEQGHARAQNNLGNFYYQNGLGLEKDYEEAVKWYRKAAEQGHWAAQFQLAECYSQGHGVAKDAVEAVRWYRKAAEQGSVVAQSRLAWSYCDSNKTEHVKWLRKAAEQGDETAQRRLVIVNYMGYLPEDQKDIVEAYKWTRVRAEDESHEWENLENIKKEMTPEQIQRGESLAHEFLSKTAPQQSLGKCPMCGSPVLETETGYACERSQYCKFRVHKILLQQPIDQEQMQKLLQTGKTDLLEGFISKAGKSFPAYLVLNNGKVVFEFPPWPQES